MTFHAKGPLGLKQPNMRGTAEERKYFWWLVSLGECCLTGRHDFQLAHTGTPAEGKGMSRKAALWTVLPLSYRLHHAEERNRAEFWEMAGFPYPEHIHWAERLYDHFTAREDPTLIFMEMRERANRNYLAQILGGQ